MGDKTLKINHILSNDLVGIIRSFDRRSYSVYKRLRGLLIHYPWFDLVVTRVQGDPHAPPSVVEARFSLSEFGGAEDLFSGETRVPIEDYVYRVFYRILRSRSRHCGSGYSCYLGVPRPSPVVLRRSGVEIDNGIVILRFYMGLPARGRRVLGGKALELFMDTLPSALDGLRKYVCSHMDSLEKACRLYVDQEYLRSWLYRNDYIAFIADNSILPRESSLSDKPMRNAVPFKSPPSLRRSVRLPSGCVVTGMALPRGVIVITGGGYHGKSTLLNAIQEGVYNHVPGDGREFVVSRRLTIKVHAEDGRAVSCVDISSFISDTPGSCSGNGFSTLDASGSTSMAASISEAVELGAEAILVDEDDSATNLLFKDSVMEKVIPWDPIKPLSMQAHSFVEKSGAGLLVISSSSSSFLCLADHVIIMKNYSPIDATDQARRLAGTCNDRIVYRRPRKRIFHGIERLKRIRARGYKLIAEYSGGVIQEIDLGRNPRIVEKGQVKLIAHIIEWIRDLDKPMTTRKLMDYIDSLLDRKSFKAFTTHTTPDLTWVSGFDAIWALNRLIGIKIHQTQ